MSKQSYVLSPLTNDELNNIFDETAIKVFNFYMKRSLFAQPEPVENQKKLPIQVPKEHIEQWVVQAIGAEPVGAGSYPVDVKKGNEFGADVKMLSCKVNSRGELMVGDSGETSLAQKFQDTGDSLDQLFKEKKYNEILEGWTKILHQKLSKVFQDDEVENIYYFFILRAETMFYLCGLKVCLDNLVDTEVERGTDSSVFIKGFIDDRLGNVKIYKAKKRMELRLRPKCWVDNNMVIPFELKRELESVNTREVFLNNQVDDYMNEIINKFFGVHLNNENR